MKFWSIGMVLAMLAPIGQAQEVVLRHNMQGQALDALATLTVQFNDAQKGKAKVVLQDAGSLDKVEKAKLPHMAFFDLDEAENYFAQPPRFLPLFQLAKDTGEKFAVADFYPQVADAVEDSSGRMHALPIGLAFPVLFRNKDAFKKAGLDPEVAPATWMQVQDMAGKLFDAGFQCPLTTTYFSRVHAENVSTQHGQQIASKDGKVALNTLINVKHLALLMSWQKSKYFHYFGPHRQGEDKFLSGECAMITADTTLYAKLSPTKGVHAGASELPYHDDTYNKTPERILPDGASIWVLSGKKKDEYKVAARFLKYLTQPDSQREWVKKTAYLPMTKSGMVALREANAFSPKLLKNAEQRLSVSRKDNSGRVRNEAERARLHEILDQGVEEAWADKKPAKQVLDEAMERANSGRVITASKSKP